MAYLSLPNFVKAQNSTELEDWYEIISHFIKKIRSIKGAKNKDETGETVHSLKHFRDYISNGKLNDYFLFSFWFADYLMSLKEDKLKFIKPFSIETLNKFYNMIEYNDNFKLSEIITDTGFLAIAKAIRKSTVSLQYTPKNARKYEIRYGVAQQLQNKSRTKIDFVSFIGEFIGIYNAETARQKEKNPDLPTRAIVKDEELNAFYALLDKYPSKLISSLLASYGFALNAKSVKDEGDDEQEHEEEQ